MYIYARAMYIVFLPSAHKWMNILQTRPMPNYTLSEYYVHFVD